MNSFLKIKSLGFLIAFFALSHSYTLALQNSMTTDEISKIEDMDLLEDTDLDKCTESDAKTELIDTPVSSINNMDYPSNSSDDESSLIEENRDCIEIKEDYYDKDNNHIKIEVTIFPESELIPVTILDDKSMEEWNVFLEKSDHHANINYNDKHNGFDCNLPPFNPDQQVSLKDDNSGNASNTLFQEQDILRDSSIEQRHEIAEYNQKLQESKISETKNYIRFKNHFDKQPTLDNLIITLSLTKTKQNALNIKQSIESKEAAKKTRRFRKKIPSASKDEIKFCEAILTNKIAFLLQQYKHSDLLLAEKASEALKELWPHKHHHTSLTPSIIEGTGETGFIAALGLNNIMKIAEIELITRQDYIDKYANSNVIKEYKQYSLSLQKSGNRNNLFTERDRLHQEVIKNGANTDITMNICLALAEKALYNPATELLSAIVHAPSLEKARNQIEQLEFKIIEQAQQKNLILISEIEKLLIEKYGFDVLQEAHSCYKSRSDYIHTTQTNSFILNPINTSLQNIEYRSLHLAHVELVRLQKQLLQGLESLNITDPIAQNEYLTKSFGENIIEKANNTYKNRSDYQELLDSFIPIDVHSNSIEILNNNHTYASVGEEFDIMRERVFSNAKLCGMEFAQELESHILDSLYVIKAPHNDAEFVFNVTVVDHILTDIQRQATAIVTAKPTTYQHSSELFIRGLSKFVHGLNPLTQATSICELIYGASKLACNVIDEAIDLTVYPHREKNFLLTADTCKSLVNTAKFVTDIVIGDTYLSPEEYRQRAAMVNNACADIMTPENAVDLVAQIAADFVFCKGFASAFIYLREIDAASKIENQFAKIANKLKEGVDTHLANNPILLTPEGVALHVPNEIKNIGIGVETINNSKTLLESIYAKEAIKLKQELKNIQPLYDGTRNGFANFTNKKIKVNYEHILGMEINLSKKDKLNLSGFHHDLNHAIKKSNALKFENTIVNANGCYITDLKMEGLHIPGKTFFPAEWSREKVINKIHEAYDNFIKNGANGKLLPDGKFKISGYTQEGIEIEMFITQKGHLNTAYPKL